MLHSQSSCNFSLHAQLYVQQVVDHCVLVAV